MDAPAGVSKKGVAMTSGLERRTGLFSTTRTTSCPIKMSAEKQEEEEQNHHHRREVVLFGPWCRACGVHLHWGVPVGTQISKMRND